PRLQQFLTWLGVLFLALTVLALLHYHEVIRLPALEGALQAQVDRATGDVQYYERLRGPGIFCDPNDLSLVLVWGIIISLYRLGERGIARLFWVLVMAVLGYALTLTFSRGGFIALVASVLILLWARYNSRKALVIALL